MLDKNSPLLEHLQREGQHQICFTAQTTGTSKNSKLPQNKQTGSYTNNVNNLKQMQGDLPGETLLTSRSEIGLFDGKQCHYNNGVLDTSHKDALTMIASSNKSFVQNNNSNHNYNTNVVNNSKDASNTYPMNYQKFNNSGSSSSQHQNLLQSFQFENKLLYENETIKQSSHSHTHNNNIHNNNYNETNQFAHNNNFGDEEEEMNINCNESDGYNNIHNSQHKKHNQFNSHINNSQTKGIYKRDVSCAQGNIETQGDEEEDEEDTSSEFIKELLQNEKKLTQRIYCSEIKALKVTKIFNDLIFSMKSELLAYLTLEDICHFKKALQYYLGRSVTKTIDAQILKLIWTSDCTLNNHLLWDTLINYSFLKEQYPLQYKRQSTTINQEHERSIRMDLDRTFPERDDFSSESNQNKLFNVLNSLSYSVKEIGYIQGWNQITGLFLLYPEFPEEMVYWIINYLMHRVSLKDLYLSIQNAYSTQPSESASEQHPAYTSQNNQGYQQQYPHSYGHQNHHLENRHRALTNKYNFDDKENDYIGYNKRNQNQMSCSSFEDKQSSYSSENHWGNSGAEPNILIKLDFLTYALKVYLKVYLTSVYRQVEKSNFTIYTQKWFTVLFSQQLPPDITLCFFAGIVLQDWNYLLKMALAVFDIFKEEILSKNDPDDIMELFYDSFQFTKEQVYNTIQKFEVTNDQLLQIMHLFEEQSDIDNIQLIDGRFFKVEQKQRKEQNSTNNNNSQGSFFERVGKFFSSTSKQESICYFEERNEVKYNPIPQGANLDDNKFSEIVHFNKLCSKKISKEYSKSPEHTANTRQNGLSDIKNPHNVHSNNQSNNGSINNQATRPFLEQRTDISRNQANIQNNNIPLNNQKASPTPSLANSVSVNQAQSNLKLYSQQQMVHQHNYKPFLSNNQLKSKEKEFDLTLQYQSQ